MNLNSLIINTLKPLVPDVVPNFYGGTATKYISFNCLGDEAVLFADNEPKINEVEMQIHLFCPLTFNSIALKKKIRLALFGVGFTYPTIDEAYETDTKLVHTVFECSMSGATEREE